MAITGMFTGMTFEEAVKSGYRQTKEDWTETRHELIFANRKTMTEELCRLGYPGKISKMSVSELQDTILEAWDQDVADNL